MAGDWIKMRHDLPSDPAVIGIAERTGLEEDHVVGKLHSLWTWADMQTLDGDAPGVTTSWIDRFLRVDGFAKAMIDVGWLEVKDTGIVFPRFDRHCSETAKNRALSAKRNEKYKRRKGDAGTVTFASPREEKRREENNTPPNPPKGELIALPPFLDNLIFRSAWDDWLAHRRELRIKRYTTRGVKAILSKLAAMGSERAVAAIRHSIAMNYQGIYEESNHHGQRNDLGRDSRVEAPPGKYDKIGERITVSAADFAPQPNGRSSAQPTANGKPDPAHPP